MAYKDEGPAYGSMEYWTTAIQPVGTVFSELEHQRIDVAAFGGGILEDVPVSARVHGNAPIHDGQALARPYRRGEVDVELVEGDLWRAVWRVGFRVDSEEQQTQQGA